MEFFITLQNNQRERDYVYEMSVMFLTARTLHLAIKLEIIDKIAHGKISLKDILNQYPDYSENSLTNIIKLLHTLKLLVISNNVVHPTELSFKLLELKDQLNINKDIWNQHFDILGYLKNETNMQKTMHKDLKITITDNCLTYHSSSPELLIFELFFSHIISRAICFAVTNNLFEILNENSENLLFDELLNTLKKRQPVVLWDDNIHGLKNLLILLSRYQILKFDPSSNLIKFSQFSPFLVDSTPDSIAASMHLVDFDWWNAASILEEGFKKEGESPFVMANAKNFAATYFGAGEKSNIFNKAMSAISLYEDLDVAQEMNLEKFDTIVDIGGGEAGLLSRLHQGERDKRRYILFEKAPDDEKETIEETKLLQQRVQEKYPNLDVKVVLGDFTKPFNLSHLPKLKNTAYLIKCVLHNIQSVDEMAKILCTIHQAIDENSELFIAERIIPKTCLTPHLNIFGAILMAMLFKAQTYTLQDYKKALDKARFNHKGRVVQAGNYLVFNVVKQSFYNHFLSHSNEDKKIIKIKQLPIRNLDNILKMGLGCMQFSFPKVLNQSLINEIVLYAVENNITYFDTAEFYGIWQEDGPVLHSNEKLLGEALAQLPENLRAKIMIGTKCGLDFRYGEFAFTLNEEQIRDSIAQSSRALQVEKLQFLMIHRLDPKMTESVFDTLLHQLLQLTIERKVEFVGFSEPTAQQIRQAHSILGNKFYAVEIAYSVFIRRAEINGVLDTCNELKINIIGYSSLMRGLLAHNVGVLSDAEYPNLSEEELRNRFFENVPINDYRREFDCFNDEHIRANVIKIKEFNQIAQKAAVTPAQLALRWLLDKNIIPIPGITSIQQLQEYIEAKNKSISNEIFREIDAKFPHGCFKGGINPPIFQSIENPLIDCPLENEEKRDCVYGRHTSP